MKYFDPENSCWLEKPADGCVNVSDEDHAELYSAPFPYGKILGVVNGSVEFIDAPAKTYPDDELSGIARAKRDFLLSEYIDKINAVRWAALSASQKTAATAFRSALLDVPQQEGFPRSITWPEIPAFLK